MYLIGLVPVYIEEVEDTSTAKSDHGELEDDPAEEISKSEAVEMLSSEHLEKLYVFSLVWGMGALLEIKDRLKYDTFLKDRFSHLNLPKNNSKNPDVRIWCFLNVKLLLKN